jgi:hypothetical protein
LIGGAPFGVVALKDLLRLRRPPLAFIHIPRTGGRSLNRAIQASWPAHARYKVKTASTDFAGLAGNITKHVRVIHGHMNYGLHEIADVRYVTVLREPVSRYLSHYQFSSFQRIGRGKRAASFEEFVGKSRLHNLQCRMIAGVWQDDAAIPDGDLVERAERHLERFWAVGFFDDLTGFAKRIGLRAGLDHVVEPRVMADPVVVDVETAAAVNAADIEFYRKALRRFGGTHPSG